ncbi:MMPL family transporter [Nocardioides sp.]|uniref:MMPL family transporter n=1 Tax=Nocardioides sp. TaxID=35761 RepID=UPI00352806E1
MSSLLYRWGRWSARRPWPALGAWLLVSVLVVAASVGVGRTLDDTMAAPGTDSQAAADLLAADGTDRGGLTAYVAATPRDPAVTFDDATPAADLRALRDRVAGADAVVTSTEVVSPDRRVAVVTLSYPPIEELGHGDLVSLKDALDAARPGSSLQIEAGGDLYFSFEEPTTNVGEVLGLVAALVILLLAFGSLLAAGLPLAVALVGLLVGASLLPLVAHLVAIPSWTPAMAAMVGLGVGIDYALLLLTRFREQRAAGAPVTEAVGQALATAGQSVVVAGGIVVVAILGLAFAGLPFVAAGGVGIAVVVLVMVLAALTLLPALLGLAGDRLTRRGPLARLLDRLPGRRAAVTGTVRRWERWGRHVTRHAGPYAVAGAVALVALSVPVLGLRLGLPDQGSMPESRTERRAYDLVAEGFGPGATGPLLVAIDSTSPRVVDDVLTALDDDPGVAAALVVPGAPDATVTVVSAQPTTAPQDEATVTTIDRLREEVLPAALEGSGAHAHVGGYSASLDDLGQRVQQRLPILVAAVVLLSFLLLMMVFRSVLVPLKAAVLNLLGVGAAYGVLVMVFQKGWGASLIGLESTVPIISFIPLFMFAILFGLSMDYEVFLLSRIREEYLRTGDSDEAVVHGLATTARTISSAAAIMVAVFGGFVLGEDPILKMLGLGLATAVLVDATVVRLVLVPAIMKLMGPANWWLPAWLDRLLPHLDVETGDPGQPAAEEPAAVPVG